MQSYKCTGKHNIYVCVIVGINGTTAGASKVIVSPGSQLVGLSLGIC